MDGACRAGNGFVHQCSANIVYTRPETILKADWTQLHPGGLNVGDRGMEDETRDGMHENGFAEGWPAAGEALQIDGRLHVNKRQGHEFRKTTGPFLKIEQTQ